MRSLDDPDMKWLLRAVRYALDAWRDYGVPYAELTRILRSKHGPKTRFRLYSKTYTLEEILFAHAHLRMIGEIT